MPTLAANEAFIAVSAAFEALGKVVALLDEDMKIVHASPALRGLLSTPDAEGRLMTDFIESEALIECLRAGRRCKAEARTVQGKFLRACGGALSDGSFAPTARYLVCFELQDETAGTSSEEAQRIIRALEANRWRRSAAARALGISRATLWRRMRELGI